MKKLTMKIDDFLEVEIDNVEQVIVIRNYVCMDTVMTINYPPNWGVEMILQHTWRVIERFTRKEHSLVEEQNNRIKEYAEQAVKRFFNVSPNEEK